MINTEAIRAMPPGGVLWDEKDRAGTLRVKCWRVSPGGFVVRVVGDRVCVMRKPVRVCPVCSQPFRGEEGDEA